MKFYLITKDFTYHTDSIEKVNELQEKHGGEIFYPKEYLKEVYMEAFQDGFDRGNLCYKYHPMALAWLVSITRRDTYPILMDQQQELLNNYESMNYDERAEYQPKMEDVENA